MGTSPLGSGHYIEAGEPSRYIHSSNAAIYTNMPKGAGLTKPLNISPELGDLIGNILDNTVQYITVTYNIFHTISSSIIFNTFPMFKFDMDCAIQAPVHPSIVMSSNSVADTYSPFSVQSVWGYLLHLSNLSHGLHPSLQNKPTLQTGA